ncbi:MAG: hypothetical protein O3A00_15620, partial [Planctomycetota bacterium]|nr:hypothetical protein [Planctomycetota bacterium]
MIVDDDFVGIANGVSVDSGIVGIDRFATIQGAVDVGAAGDTVQIKSGSYAESVSISKSLVVEGTGNARLGLVSAGLLNSVTSHVLVSVIGGAIVDANDSLDNIVAGSALLEGQRGVGIDQASVIPSDPIDTNVRMLRGAGGQGGFYVENAGPLTLGENGLQHAVRTMGGAHVEIEARGALTGARDVMAG